MSEKKIDSCSVSRKVRISSEARESGFVERSYAPSNGASTSNDLYRQCSQRADWFSPGPQLANIISVGDGVVKIDFPGNSIGPRPARSTVPLRNLNEKVLIVLLPDGEPLIIGQVYESVPINDVEDENSNVFIKGRRVRIETTSELVLIAGKTKIHLDSRGKVVISADQIVSRARSTNKVQGGSVQIN